MTEKLKEISPIQVSSKWEDSHVEYKLSNLSLSRDIWETVSAFANEGGGLVFLGYKKDNDVYIPIGVENPAKIIDDFTSTISQKFNFCPFVKPDIFEDDGKTLISI